jgi:hypothetical protein
MGFCVQRLHFMYAVTAHPLHRIASRRLLAYDIPAYDIFFIFLFLIPAPRWWWRSGILSRLCFFYSLALFAHFQYDVLYKL